MNTAQALEWLYSTQQFGLKLGLENIRCLLTTLGNPQDQFRALHVAGTNGKGSVCAMLEQILRDQGYRTGLYTSPHLVRFHERIRINGNEISDSELADELTRLRKHMQGMIPHPTFFEITTALAFKYFAENGVEIAIVETGMGGRLDSTNVIRPLVSILTPISLDHQKWLGETLPKIASEKAGIIKPGIPVVSALQSPEVRPVLENVAPIRWVTEPLMQVPIGIPGLHQTENAALALAALDASGLRHDTETAKKSLAKVRWPGRFQTVQSRFILDGTHNPHAARSLVQTWKIQFPNQQTPIIFGMLHDKDSVETLRILSEIASEFHFVPVRSERSSPPEVLARDLVSLTVPHSVHPSLHQAIKSLETTSPILITGSLFLVGEALALLENDRLPPPSDQ